MHYVLGVDNYYTFGKSAMSECVALGPIVGRPCDGNSVVVKNKLLRITECIFCADRYYVIRVGNLINLHMYFPCVGTCDRMCIIKDVFQEALSSD